MRARCSAALVGLLLLAAQPDAARELMRFLASSRALAVIEAQGMEP